MHRYIYPCSCTREQTGVAELQTHRAIIKHAVNDSRLWHARNMSAVVQSGCLVPSSDGNEDASIQVGTLYLTKSVGNLMQCLPFVVEQRAALAASNDEYGVVLEIGAHAFNNEAQFEEMTTTKVKSSTLSRRRRERNLMLAVQVATGTTNRNTDKDYMVKL